MLREDAPGGVYGRPEDWPRWAVLLPHVLAATSHTGDGLDEGPALECSWLLDRAGTYLQTQGRYREAVPLMQRALAIDERVHGPDHPEVATSLNNLALVLQELGDPAGARPLAERALAIDEQAYGSDHPYVAILLNNVAAVLQELGERDTAAAYRARADAIRAAQNTTHSSGEADG